MCPVDARKAMAISGVHARCKFRAQSPSGISGIQPCLKRRRIERTFNPSKVSRIFSASALDNSTTGPHGGRGNSKRKSNRLSILRASLAQLIRSATSQSGLECTGSMGSPGKTQRLIVSSNSNNPDISKSQDNPFPLVCPPVTPVVNTRVGSQTLRLLL